jgi:hypothetical protein
VGGYEVHGSWVSLEREGGVRVRAEVSKMARSSPRMIRRVVGVASGETKGRALIDLQKQTQ